MKISKVNISQDKLDINYKFYLFLKELNGGNGLTGNMLPEFLQIVSTYPFNEGRKLLFDLVYNNPNIGDGRKENIISVLEEIESNIDYKAFSFALKLILIKPLLLEEAKLAQTSKLINSDGLHPLSIQYDRIKKSSPYYTRVNGALISLIFFAKLENKDTSFLIETNEQFIKLLLSEFEEITKHDIEPNQIFMIMFMESVDQSIVSDAGGSYEDRIQDVLISLGIPREKITKVHDKDDSSTEFDFFFELEGRTFGIGAKRTLRERYKQFIKTAQMSQIDVMIEVTLGLDLTKAKVDAISKHGVYLFVADEIYNSQNYLHSFKNVYPVSRFTQETFKSLK